MPLWNNNKNILHTMKDIMPISNKWGAHGLWVIYYDNIIVYKANWVNGKPQGFVIDFYGDVLNKYFYII
jgi:hypothetical protein